MVDSRANLKIERETRDRLREHKPTGQTWDEFLNGLLDNAPVEANVVELSSEQVGAIARATGDEIEGRMR